MKHLFIINPMAEKNRGRVNSVMEEIESFFESNAQLKHDVRVTKWARDAEGYVRRYVSGAEETVRVHVFGGSGTLFEAVNGVIGMPNAQVATYPMGRSNYFLRYFGNDKLHLFSSIRNQVFSGVTSIDVINCGGRYGISHGLVGIEAATARDGRQMIDRTHLPTDFCFLYSVTKNSMNKNAGQHYEIQLDGQSLSGDYISMMIANVPCYGRNMDPAIDAHPNDGVFDAYLIKNVSRFKRLSVIPAYASGNYCKLPDCILHYRGSKIIISSDSVICTSVDGETFYEDTVEYEIIPHAIDFVCPAGIDLGKIPRLRNRPEEGYVGD